MGVRGEATPKPALEPVGAPPGGRSETPLLFPPPAQKSLPGSFRRGPHASPRQRGAVLSARALVSQHGVPKSGLWKGFSGAPTVAKAAVGYLGAPRNTGCPNRVPGEGFWGFPPQRGPRDALPGPGPSPAGAGWGWCGEDRGTRDKCHWKPIRGMGRIVSKGGETW